jgi:hypothetical protein
MSNRYALIIGSNNGTNQYQKKLNQEVMSASIKGMAECLSNLGPGYSFSLIGKGGYFANPSYKKVRDTIEKLSAENDDVFFIFYYGHAQIGINNLCLLAYSDLSSSKRKPTSGLLENCTLENLVKVVIAQGFSKVMVILDCCHSGYAATGLGSWVPYWSLFSSTGSSVQYEASQSNPFTDAIISTLSDEDLRAAASRPGDTALTVESLANFVKSKVANENGLDPKLTGNFSDFNFAPIKLNIQASINSSAPNKSLYKKLFAIGCLFNAKGLEKHQLPFGAIRTALERDPTFFITDRSGKKVLISDGTLREYMHIGTLLGLWKENGRDAWISVDDKKIDPEGTLFNKFIVSGVFRYLPVGMEPSTLRRAVREILHADNEPTFWRIDKVIQDKHGQWQNEIEPKYKRIMIRLLGYSKVLRQASADTFFPR